MSEFRTGWKAGERAAWSGKGGPSFYSAPRNEYERGYMRGWLFTRLIHPSAR